VAAEVWPGAFLASGALAVGLGLVVAFVPRAVAAAAVLAVLDLLVVNSGLNPAADGGFYALRPEVRALVEQASGPEPYRWFSYGIAGSLPLRFRFATARAPSDVWLYYLDRQTLLPRTHVLDGLEGAFDEDRVGWAPAGSTLHVSERRPARFAAVHHRLRLANVRWVLSFHPLPEDLVTVRAVAHLPEIHEPLRLHELSGALPRAFWAARPDDLPQDGAAPVLYERTDPHTVRLTATTPPGYLVVLDGRHAGWRAHGAAGPVPLVPAHGRYWAVPTPGGAQQMTVRYAPAWRAPALAAATLGALAALGLVLAPGRRAAAIAEAGA
jgi:hypothetical protein